MWWIIGAVVYLFVLVAIVLFFMGTKKQYPKINGKEIKPPYPQGFLPVGLRKKGIELNVGDKVFVRMDDGTFKPGVITEKKIIHVSRN